MASAELRRLWALHEIDAQIRDIKRQAARLDVGAKEAARLKELESDSGPGAEAKRLVSEQMDTELKQRGFDEKVKKFEKQLFSGSVTSAREVESINKEIGMLKRSRDAFDDRLLELMDLVPPAQAELDRVNVETQKAKEALAAKRRTALAEKTKLESEYKAAMIKHAVAKNDVPASLLNRYESIAKRQDGIGMAEVIKGKSCGACGTLLPTRTLHAALEGSVITCESCHRILYYTDGAI